MLEREINGTRYRLLGVGVSALADAEDADPADLIDQSGERRAAAERAMDRVRGKFGHEAMMKGLALEEKEDPALTPKTSRTLAIERHASREPTPQRIISLRTPKGTPCEPRVFSAVIATRCCLRRPQRRLPRRKSCNRRPHLPGIARSGTALARDLCRDRQGADPSALHELPSRRRSAAAGRRASRSTVRRRIARAPAYSPTPARPATPTRNFTVPAATTFQSIPGHPRWELAPLSMAWEGKSLGEICRQLKDKDRNGGRDLALLQEHIAKDDLVAWGWNPGAGREPAPGSQELAGRLVQAWIDSGAECP